MEKSIHKRGLTSLLAAAGLLVMGLSGLIIYIVPHSRIVFWTDWRLLGLSKTLWGNIHIISSLLFLVAGGFHLYFNWRPFLNYLKDKVKGGIRLKRELAITLAAGSFVVVSGIFPFPPLGWLIDLKDAVKQAWVVSPTYEPPFARAEKLSLGVFCKKVGIDPAKAREILQNKGVVGVSLNRRLEDIARANRTSPMRLFALIKHLEKNSGPRSMAKPFTAPSVEERFAGTGYGKRTIAHMAKISGQKLNKVQERLAAAGLSAAPGDTVKKAAEKNRLSAPVELLKTMLVDGYRPAKR